MSARRVAPRAAVWALAAVLALGSSTWSPAPVTAAGDVDGGVVGPLRVVGNRLVDGNGRTLVLRGVHRDGTQRQPFGGSDVPVTPTEVAAMRAWGANVVRIPVSSSLWTQVCPTQHDPTYATEIDRVVRWVTGAGMVAIIDLHTTSGSQCGPQGRHAAPAADAVAFWRSAAAHYANWPLVMFELFNEPHATPPACRVGPCSSADWWRLWRNGSRTPVVDRVRTDSGRLSPTQGMTPSSYVPVGQQKLYDTIQATPARNVVIVDADGWAADPGAIKHGFGINDYNHNVVYGVHPYTCVVPADPCSGRDADMHANFRVLRAFKTVARTHPVLATEFGWPRPHIGGRFLRQTYAFLDRQRPAWGSVAFAWDGSTTGAFSLLTTTAPSFRPNENGQIIKAELLAN